MLDTFLTRAGSALAGSIASYGVVLASSAAYLLLRGALDRAPDFYAFAAMVAGLCAVAAFFLCGLKRPRAPLRAAFVVGACAIVFYALRFLFDWHGTAFLAARTTLFGIQVLGSLLAGIFVAMALYRRFGDA